VSVLEQRSRTWRIQDEALSEHGLRAMVVLLAAPANTDPERDRCAHRNCPGRGLFDVLHRGGEVWLCRACARYLAQGPDA
jgi:hypothetical protein